MAILRPNRLNEAQKRLIARMGTELTRFIQRFLREPLNKSTAALSGSFAPTDRFENLEIRKGFLQFPNLNLEQNPSLTTLAIQSEVPKVYKSDAGKVDVNAHPLMPVHRFTVVNLDPLDDSVSTFGTKCSIFGTCLVVF